MNNALTRDEYMALMADRTRPLFEPYMVNERATRWRETATAVQADPIADVLEAMIADRTERGTVNIPITTGGVHPHIRKPRASRCGTEDGFDDHRTADTEPCGPCVAAHTLFVKKWLAA